MVERIDITVNDRVSTGPARKLLDLARNADRAADEIDRLEANIDGLTAAQAALVSALSRTQNSQARLLNAQVRSATASERQAVTAQRLATEQSRTAAATERAANAATRARIALTQEEAASVRLAKAKQQQATSTVRANQATERHNRVLGLLGGVTRQTRARIQQTSFQFQDIAVQIQAGTDASIIASQQLPQLAGAYGAVGAAIGAVLAVGIPIAAQFIDLNAIFGTTVKQIRDLETATNDYIESAREVIRTSASLATEFGNQTEQARELARIEREILQLQAQAQAQSVFAAIAEDISNVDFGDLNRLIGLQEREIELIRENQNLLASGANRDLTDEIRNVQQEITALIDAEQGLVALRRQFDLGSDDAEQLALAIGGVQQASNFDEQAAAFRRLREVVVATIDPFNTNNEEVQNLVLSIAQAERNAIRLSEGARAVTFDEATASAQNLTSELQTALNVLGNLQDRQALGNVSGAGLNAQEAALAAGASREQARAEAQIAETRARLAPALAAEGPLRAAALATLQQESETIRGNASTQERINGILSERNRQARANRRSGGGGRPGTRSTPERLAAQILQLDQQLTSVFDREAGRIEQIRVQQTERLDLIRRGIEARVISEQEGANRVIEINRAAAEEIRQIEVDRNAAILNSASSTAAQLADVAKNFAGEQSTTYRALFAVSKGFAIAESIIKIQQALSQVLADPTALTPAQKIANFAVIAAQGANIISQISSVALATGGQVGQAARAQGVVSGPGGTRADLVPATLSNREFVVNAAATARNLPTLQAINSGATVPAFQGGGAVAAAVRPAGIPAAPTPQQLGGQAAPEREIMIVNEIDPSLFGRALQQPGNVRILRNVLTDEGII